MARRLRNALESAALRQRQAENLERRRAEAEQIRLDALASVMAEVAVLASRWPVETRRHLSGWADTGDAPDGAENLAGPEANAAEV